jgi:hypothetical protein
MENQVYAKIDNAYELLSGIKSSRKNKSFYLLFRFPHKRWF